MRNKDIYLNKENYQCDLCGKLRKQWEFDVFDRDRKICSKCFDKEE